MNKKLGFTLIEIMMVMIIIGITIGLVSVNLGKDDNQILRDEVQRLTLLFEAARDEALNTGKALAWRTKGQQYGFYYKDSKSQWNVSVTETSLRTRKLPPQITLSHLEINGQSVSMDTPVIFSSVGMSTPFQLKLQTQNKSAVIQGDATGQIIIIWNTEQTS